MAAHGARRLAAMAENAAQHRRHRAACGRAGLRLPRAAAHRARRSSGCARCCASACRDSTEDRYLAPDIAAAAELVRSGALAAAAGCRTCPELEGTTGMSRRPWLTVKRGEAPLLVSFPHTGLDIPADCDAGLVSPALARHDADWHIDKLYAFAAELGATTVHTALSRTVIDVNRDPSGASLYPGQATTGLVPTETFDGRPLYRDGAAPTPEEIERRKQRYFAPYHAALAGRARAPARAASARRALRLPLHPLGDPAPVSRRAAGVQHRHQCRRDAAIRRWRPRSPRSARRAGGPHVVNGRFKGGWITRNYGRPADGVHAVQMELALPRLSARRERSAALGCRISPSRSSRHCARVLEACLAFAAAVMRGRPDDHPHLDNARIIRAPRGTEAHRQELADRSAAAHADEQSRSRGGGEAARARGLRRHRPRRARLGELRPHRRGAARRSKPTRRCACSRASRSACSAPMPTRRAC